MAKKHSRGGGASRGSLKGTNSGMAQSTGAYSRVKTAGGGNSNRRLTTANSAMTPSPGMQRPGRAKNSVVENARSSTPTSILSGARHYIGPLSSVDWPPRSVAKPGK